MSNFKPNIIILNAGYSQGSSGGQVIGGASVDPGSVFFNTETNQYALYDEDGWWIFPSLDDFYNGEGIPYEGNLDITQPEWSPWEG